MKRIGCLLRVFGWCLGLITILLQFPILFQRGTPNAQVVYGSLVSSLITGVCTVLLWRYIWLHDFRAVPLETEAIGRNKSAGINLIWFLTAPVFFTIALSSDMLLIAFILIVLGAPFAHITMRSERSHHVQLAAMHYLLGAICIPLVLPVILIARTLLNPG